MFNLARQEASRETSERQQDQDEGRGGAEDRALVAACLSLFDLMDRFTFFRLSIECGRFAKRQWGWLWLWLIQLFCPMCVLLAVPFVLPTIPLLGSHHHTYHTSALLVFLVQLFCPLPIIASFTSYLIIVCAEPMVFWRWSTGSQIWSLWTATTGTVNPTYALLHQRDMRNNSVSGMYRAPSVPK